jgi:hypothetical protein
LIAFPSFSSFFLLLGGCGGVEAEENPTETGGSGKGKKKNKFAIEWKSDNT